MSEPTQQVDMTKQGVVYRLPRADAASVRRDLEFRGSDSGSLALDIYRPPDSEDEARLPAVIFVSGYPDPGFETAVGCKFKEMQAYVSWGRLAAASGLVAITHTNTEPTADLHALLRHVRENAAALGVDESRIGVWACSGNVPNALSLLMGEQRDRLRCAVLCYGYMLDLAGSTAVAEASKSFGFANPCAGKTVDDLAEDVPLFIAKAARDEMPGLNGTIDRFMGEALTRNLPVTFVNHPSGPHAFDLMHDSATSREIIRQILAFMQFHLLG